MGLSSSIPILVIFFNRPDSLGRVLRALQKVRPKRLFFAVDGPRVGNNKDAVAIKECIDTVQQIVHWTKEIQFLQSEVNLGCDEWIPQAISWFFLHVQSGIILEDDCLVDEGFFQFAGEMLTRYEDISRVMNISAANFNKQAWGEGDYYFSRYPANWGWATWKRAWASYEHDVSKFSADFLSMQRLSVLLKDQRQAKFWIRFASKLRDGSATFWDAKWFLSILRNDGVSITPNFNLVSNIGYGDGATHTHLKTPDMEMEIVTAKLDGFAPPALLEPNSRADIELFDMRYKPTILGRLLAMHGRLVRLIR